MEWLNIHVAKQLRGPACVGSSPAELGAWLLCLAYCCEQENGGRIIGAAAWKDRQLQRAIGVSLSEIKKADRLLQIDGDDILVNGYPEKKQADVQRLRGQSHAAALKRWGKRDQVMPQGMPDGMPQGMPDGNAEGEGEGEGKGEGEGERAPPPPPPEAWPGEQPAKPVAVSDDDQWRYEIGATPWVRTLKEAGCKIGPKSWRAWRAMIDRVFGGSAESAAAAAVKLPPGDRWHDQVEAAAPGAPKAEAPTNAGKDMREKFPELLRYIATESIAAAVAKFGAEQIEAACEKAERIGVVEFDAKGWNEMLNGRKSQYGGWDIWEPMKPCA